ncbi:hypothetical protein MKX03_014426 [Papaver bracteatum]|nr:hypothetical protein MKX03_014426 [Papaver bracteatum]
MGGVRTQMDIDTLNTRSKTREERLLETIVTSGGVRLQPTRDALQVFLAEALKLDAVVLSPLEYKLQSHLWQPIGLDCSSVLEAHRCLNKDIQISQRMITISTVGVPNTIKKLASHKLQSTLAVSLHAPNQRLRETIVPSAKSYPPDTLMKDCREYFDETSRRVSFEYTLLAGVNDAVEHAVELVELLRAWEMILAFAAALESRRVTTGIRRTRGLDVNAACGQLRNSFQKSPLVAASDMPITKPEMVAVVG